MANIQAIHNDTLTLAEWKKAREEEEERMRKEEDKE